MCDLFDELCVVQQCQYVGEWLYIELGVFVGEVIVFVDDWNEVQFEMMGGWFDIEIEIGYVVCDECCDCGMCEFG